MHIMRKLGPLAAILTFGFVAGCAAAPSEGRERSSTPARESGQSSVDPTAISADKFDEIDQFFHRKASQVQFECYNREVEKEKKKFEGNVAFSLVVVPGGKVADIKIIESTLKSPGIESCVVDKMNEWEWPEVPGRAPYTGSLNFKPAW